MSEPSLTSRRRRWLILSATLLVTASICLWLWWPDEPTGGAFIPRQAVNRLEPGVLGFEYRQSLSPYLKFGTLTGDLPPGLHLEDEWLVGKPTRPGSFRFEVMVRGTSPVQRILLEVNVLRNPPLGNPARLPGN